MVAIKWKKTLIFVTDCLLAVYIIFAMTAFNRPDQVNNTCNEVNIHIEESLVKGFLNADDVKTYLQRAHLYPLGTPMDQVDCRQIEESLIQNPFVKSIQCYKTQTGHINITLSQRQPVIRVKADNGEDYYVDEHGFTMPNTRFTSDLVIATGNIHQKYAKKKLRDIGTFLVRHPLWRSQVEQIHVLRDESVEIIPRVGDHIVYLGKPDNLERKFNRLEKFYKYGLSKAGWNKYSYIDIEFDNQIICKKRPMKQGA